jgi:adenylate cyclase
VTEPVALESILSCLRGVIPSPFATCSIDGTPNVTYISIVQYVDPDRVALSRQFFNKTRANLDANPNSQVRVVEPETMREYALDLEYLHTETHGPIFDAMNANNEAIASQSGMESVFRLRGVDIHRVVRCAVVEGTGMAHVAQPDRGLLGQLDELTRRLALITDYDEATRVALESLDDLFGFRQTILLVRDPADNRLFAVASSGYPSSAAGAEVAVGVGVIGIAAERRQVVCVPNLARTRVMQAAIDSGAGSDAPPAREIPLPGLADAQSVAAVPLLAHGDAIGVLYLESSEAGVFGPHNERLLRIVGAHVASVLGSLDAGSTERPRATSPEQPPSARAATGRPLRVTYYQADDSVFVGDEYVIKGVPGRILWKVLNEHAADGRDTFTNRELRLDERLGLPPGKDNLEARLLVLRKRLAGGEFEIGLERVGRGRLLLRVAHPLELVEVPTSGPMRAAHEPQSS